MRKLQKEKNKKHKTSPSTILNHEIFYDFMKDVIVDTLERSGDGKIKLYFYEVDSLATKQFRQEMCLKHLIEDVKFSLSCYTTLLSKSKTGSSKAIKKAMKTIRHQSQRSSSGKGKGKGKGKNHPNKRLIKEFDEFIMYLQFMRGECCNVYPPPFRVQCSASIAAMVSTFRIVFKKSDKYLRDVCTDVKKGWNKIEVDIRRSWSSGSKVKVWSQSQKIWLPGTISHSKVESNPKNPWHGSEYLRVKYGFIFPPRFDDFRRFEKSVVPCYEMQKSMMRNSANSNNNNNNNNNKSSSSKSIIPPLPSISKIKRYQINDASIKKKKQSSSSSSSHSSADNNNNLPPTIVEASLPPTPANVDLPPLESESQIISEAAEEESIIIMSEENQQKLIQGIIIKLEPAACSDLSNQNIIKKEGDQKEEQKEEKKSSDKMERDSSTDIEEGAKAGNAPGHQHRPLVPADRYVCIYIYPYLFSLIVYIYTYNII